jgi:hypothetical protein
VLTPVKNGLLSRFSLGLKIDLYPLKFIVEGDDNQSRRATKDRTKLIIRTLSKNNTGTNAVSPISVNLHRLVLAGKHPLSFGEDTLIIRN